MATAHKINQQDQINTEISGNQPNIAALQDASIARNAENYDRVPYTSHPFAQTQPARLAAIATLFGLTPPPIATARVLEIGSASGGNLIPLAARFPEAQFSGIDISSVQVGAGQERYQRLGLSNIDIQCISITEFQAEAAAFDYIICHGVFSWVAAPVRDAILAKIGKWLAPNGVADISYNVMPGWRMRQAVRDAMILHAGLGEDPSHRVTRARWILNFLKEHTATQQPWGQMFRNEAAMLSRLPDDYILHEFLEDTNEPMTLTAFVEQARAHNLAYLGDADIAMMIPENLNPTTSLMLREMCGGQILPVEQYMDIVTGRTFRQSLMVRVEAEAAISRRLDPARIEALHLVASRDLRKTIEADQSTLFADGAGRNLRTAHPDVVAALDRLIGRLPGSAQISDLINPDCSSEARLAITDALVKMLQVGLLNLSMEPVLCTLAISERPTVLPMNRIDAQTSRFSVNARHESVELGLVAQVLMPGLDGTRDRVALQALVLAAVASGALRFQREGVTITTPAGLAAEAANHVEAVLRDLAFAGLLVG